MNGFTESKFSLLFALNAFGAMAGAYCCTFIMKFVKQKLLITICLAGAVFAAIGLNFFSFYQWYFFSIFTFLTTFFICMNRPITTSFILEQVEHDIGSATSFMVFLQLMFGAFCMFIVSGAHSNRLLVFNLLVGGVGLFVFICWSILKKRV